MHYIGRYVNSSFDRPPSAAPTDDRNLAGRAWVRAHLAGDGPSYGDCLPPRSEKTFGRLGTQRLYPAAARPPPGDRAQAPGRAVGRQYPDSGAGCRWAATVSGGEPGRSTESGTSAVRHRDAFRLAGAGRQYDRGRHPGRRLCDRPPATDRGPRGDCRGALRGRGHGQTLAPARQEALSGSRQCGLCPDPADPPVSHPADSRHGGGRVPGSTPAALSEQHTAGRWGGLMSGRGVLVNRRIQTAARRQYDLDRVAPYPYAGYCPPAQSRPCATSTTIGTAVPTSSVIAAVICWASHCAVCSTSSTGHSARISS